MALSLRGISLSSTPIIVHTRTHAFSNSSSVFRSIFSTIFHFHFTYFWRCRNVYAKHQCERVEGNSSSIIVIIIIPWNVRNGHVRRDTKSVDGCYKQINKKVKKNNNIQTNEWMSGTVAITYYHWIRWCAHCVWHTSHILCINIHMYMA